jgi:1,4-dihydroxy-2-naphthoate octaprenyltransferase|tara:strand:- start:1001 stop:2287 length:1287 start_codon:yes stop_codon:yes gene_type:complete
MVESDKIISVITCDVEGRIETFNENAEKLFGYSADELVGKKRVSLFSPGMIVLGHIENWLKNARENKKGHNTETVFVRKDGSEFAAKITLTATMKDGKHIGYCGRTTELPNVSPAEAMPETTLLTKFISIVAITRLPFLSATWIPIIASIVWGIQSEVITDFNWNTFALVFLGGSFLHLAANTYNDYFDWTSGTDQLNNDYFLQLSGGSRAIELGLITEKQLFKLATLFLFLSGVLGLGIMTTLGDNKYDLLYYGFAGAFSAYFYTGYPLRLVARNGIGEVLIGLNYGPLMTMGSVFALTGIHSWEAFYFGFPLGILTTAILWINQFPDRASDKIAGKNHLVVMLGLERSSWGYLILMISAFTSIYLLFHYQIVEKGALLGLLGLPIALYYSYQVMTKFDTRELAGANWGTIGIHSITGSLIIIGMYI